MPDCDVHFSPLVCLRCSSMCLLLTFGFAYFRVLNPQRDSGGCSIAWIHQTVCSQWLAYSKALCFLLIQHESMLVSCHFPRLPHVVACRFGAVMSLRMREPSLRVTQRLWKIGNSHLWFDSLRQLNCSSDSYCVSVSCASQR